MRGARGLALYEGEPAVVPWMAVLRQPGRLEQRDMSPPFVGDRCGGL